jgi:Rod binding domain-containing protein
MIAPVPSLNAAASRPLSLEELSRRPQPEDAARRAEAARQFEAMLVRQILTEAQKPVFRSSLVKDSITQGGGLGLARALLEQWQTPSAPAERRPLTHEGAS